MWVMSYTYATLLIFITIFKASSANYGDPYWQRFNVATDWVPSDAIVGGHESLGTLYIIRASHGASMTPGKFISYTRQAYIPWGYGAHAKNNLEILRGSNYEWVSASRGYVPPGAVVGGYSEVSRETLYVGRASHDGYIIPGKIQPSHHTLYIAYGGIEIAKDYYEVLVVPQKKIPRINGDAAKTVIKGNSINLICRIAEGIPSPTITWEFKAKNSYTFVSKSVYGEVLYLGTVGEGDEGSYKCVARNDAGETYHTIPLTVIIPPNIVPSSSNVYKKVEGQDHALQIPCTATGTPKPVISWKFNGVNIQSNAKFTIQDGSLVINEPKVSDSGTYTCEATNQAGHTQVTFQTNILQAPKLSGEPTKTVVKGQSLDIDCKVLKGVPEPTITWQFKSKDNTKFESIPGSDSVLRISNVDVKNTGSYKCIAHNEVDTDEHVTAITVEFVPYIVSDNLKPNGLEGDVALRIPCNAVGVPKPVLTWKIDSTVITPNAHYSIIDGALIIKDPKQSDSKAYKCEAKNYLGQVDATYKATITSFLEDYGTVHEENVSKGTSTRLKCGSGDPSQSIRWFVEGVDTGVKGQYYDLANVDVTFDGNYTCRVSDMNGGHTETYEVIVGSPPKFYYGQEAPQFDWSGNERDDLDCDVEAKPPADFKWMLNGEVISNQTSSRLSVPGKWGHYTCNVSNIHGSVQRHFDVISSQCLIPRKPKNIDTMPLILSSAFNWPVLDSTTDYLTVPPEDTVIFSCPNFGDKINSLQNFSGLNEVIAICVKQDIFKVQGKLYKVSDLQCAQQVHSVVIEKRKKCLTEGSELMRVGHEVHGFLETYEVCLDVSHNIPLYTRAVMSKSNRGVGHTYSWNELPGLAVHNGDTTYTCTNSTSSCCYSNTQLLNARDVSDGPPQKTTFIRPLNAVPYWQPCDMTKSPWHTIENLVRSRIDSYDQFVVWSGTHLLQNINGTVAPRYLWKVIRFADDDALAMVYVNGPSPSNADFLCRNICAGDSDDEGVQWIREYNQYTYCCDVDEFLRAFNLSGTTIGEQLDAALNKVLSRN